MKVYLVPPKDDPPFVIHATWEAVLETLEGGDEGEEWLIKIAELSLAPIEAAPEFEGW